MPVTTPAQKIKQVKLFGKENVEVVLKGDTFDDAYNEALLFSNENKAVFVHPFDDEWVIAGQGTVGLEIIEDTRNKIDFLFFPIGGGGLAAGVVSVFKQLSPETKLIGVEPQGAASMKTSLENGKNTALTDIDKFVDGAAVKRVGDKTFEICQHSLDDIILVPEGKVCTTILQLYNEEAIVVEPAGALSIAALDLYKDQIKGKNVVCIVSGSNNDITRMEEIKERSLIYEGLKHYFIVNFPQRPGALKEFVNDVLGENDDITYFQFTKQNNREEGPAVVGVELKNRSDLDKMEQKMKTKKILEDKKIYAYHGVLPEEAIIGNHYVVSLEVHSDLEKASQSDDLKDTINYAEINDIVHQEMGVRSQLLEHVIGRIIAKIENQFPQITFIKIKLTKTIPPMPGEMKGVSLEFEKEIN